MASRDKKIQPDWWSKTLAGVLLGLTFSFALVGCFAWYGPGGITADSKVQFNMWITPAIWLPIMSFVYLFNNGKQAWMYLGGANVLAYAALFLLR
ncbi:hypothetical protein ACMZOO_12675 [Catenovulum sp. SX2]|uniref:hypothetical protein n=1 Tax=Catenovulum sp. SX2 TaxID=3398614 RepID=UPI003F8417CD